MVYRDLVLIRPSRIERISHFLNVHVRSFKQYDNPQHSFIHGVLNQKREIMLSFPD